MKLNRHEVHTRFTQNLAAFRMARGLTQAELAEKCDIGILSISHYECGRRRPGMVNLLALAMALEVTVEELVSEPSSEKAGCVGVVRNHGRSDG